MKRFLFILVIFIYSTSEGQESVIDSLKNVLEKYTDYNENYVDVLNDISFEFVKSDPSKAGYYINLAIAVSKELSYEKGLIRATTNKGSSYWVIGLQDESLSYYLLALTYNAENYPLEYTRINNNIAEVFKKKKLFDSAGKYYKQALRMVEERLPDQKPVILFANVAEIFFMKDEFDSSRYYYELCLANSNEQKNKRGLAYAYAGLAGLAFADEDIKGAIELQNFALSLRKEDDDVRGIIQSFQAKANYSIHLSQYDSALYFWNKAEAIAIDYRALDLLNEIYLDKYQYYYIIGQFKYAADYIQQYQLLKDSLQSQEFISSLNRIKGALLAEISETENLLLRQEQIRERAVNRARLVLITSVSILGFIIAFLVYQRRKKNKIRHEAKHESIFNKSLLKLSKEVNLRQPNFPEFIEDFLQNSSKSLQAERASYWVYDKDERKLSCYKLFQDGKFRKQSDDIKKADYPIFFNELLSNRTLAINEINESKFTDLKTHFIPNTKLKSLIYATLFLDDELIGIISFSTIKEIREWTYAEQRYVGSLADILVSALAYNQSKQLEVEKEKLIEKLKSRNQSLREFNSVISHNLREPLTQIIGFSDLLMDMMEDKKSNIGTMITNISKASQKIDTSIKDLSTVLNESDPLPEDYRMVEMPKLLKEVLDLLPKQIERSRPEISENFYVNEVFTYKPFLFDILYHLISNSLKFAISDQPLKIEIETQQKGAFFELQIKDNGSGFDLKKFEKKLFKMYERFHLTSDGRGIGLYLIKNRVTVLGGEISIESGVNKGTTVIITLPA